MTKHIVNIDELEFREWGHGDRFQAKLGSISSRIGASQLGYNLTVLAPGKAAFPLHNHRVNEEMFMVLEGHGEIRIGADRFPIRQGDVIACPAGGRDLAHQIINSSDGDLRFLAVSTQQSPEVAEYPDSDKIGVLGQFTDDSGNKQPMRLLIRGQAEMPDYWEGE